MRTPSGSREHPGSTGPDTPDGPVVDALIWVEPALCAPSGGRQYNRHVMDQLSAAGTAVHLLQAEGAWPAPTQEQRRRVCRDAAQLAAQSPPAAVVVDGLIGSCTPELLSSALPAPTVLLVHLPLTAEHQDSEPVRPAPGQPGRAPTHTAGHHRTEAQAVHRADAVVATSSWTAEDLRRRFGRPGIEVISPGVHAPSVHAPGTRSPGRPAAGVPQPPYRLTMAAAFNRVKNHLLLPGALETLTAFDWELVLAGPGAEQGYGADTLAELHRRLPGRIRHLGTVPPQQMPEIWAQTDLLLLPSWAETYGMVITEACAHGVPAVVSAGTGAEQTLGDAGVARDPARPELWTQILRHWMQDPGLRAQWAAAAHRRSGRLPTWAQTANRWQSLLASLPTG